MTNGTNGFIEPFNVCSLAFSLVPLMVVSHCWMPLINPLGTWSLTLQTIQEGEILVLHPGKEIEAQRG